jgi:transglutaminase-like putative cysteine protease
MTFKKALSIFFLCLSFFVSFPLPAFASEDFTTDVSAKYTVLEGGGAQSLFRVTLTNNSGKSFASSYEMRLGFDDIKNLDANDQLGDVETQLEKTGSGYVLTFRLNRKPIGIGSKTTFQFSFDTESLVRRTGRVMEVNIPGIADPSNFDNFTIDVDVPDSYGSPTYIKPDVKKEVLSFDKSELGKSGISIGFGDKQSYEYSLTYNLINTNFYPSSKKIAIPSDTNYQKVLVESIEPKPLNVTIDQDGNWLAEYRLSPLEEKKITVKGISEISLVPSKVTLSNEEKMLYTRPTQYWQADDAEIKKIADTLKSPEEIYSYTIDALNYDFERVVTRNPRLGAKKAISNPESAVCLEFTDLFIALARANGIPAREINGFAQTENHSNRPLSLIADVLHAWPEYYDSQKETWVMIDPTWGSTTGGVDYFNVLDFNHFAFVRKGVRDDFPIPAGGYKSKSEDDIKYVTVNPTDKKIFPTGEIKFAANFSGDYVAGLPIKTTIKIINYTGAALPPQTFQVSSSHLTPALQESTIPAIPPYGSESVEIYFDNKDLLTNRQAEFTMAYAGKSEERNIKVVPFFLSVKGGIAIGILTLIILITAAKARRLRIFG